MKMSRRSKEVLFGVAKGLVVAGYVYAAVCWAKVENPFRKGGLLDDESEEKEKSIDKEIKDFNKRWEEANEKIKNKE